MGGWYVEVEAGTGRAGRRAAAATGRRRHADGPPAARRAASTAADGRARRRRRRSAWRWCGWSGAGSASRTCSSTPGCTDERRRRPTPGSSTAATAPTTARASAPPARCAACHATRVQRVMGLRRPARYKILPMLSAVIAYVPAIVFVGLAALIKDDRVRDDFLPTYGQYYGFIISALIVFAVVRRARGAVPRPPHRHARPLPRRRRSPAHYVPGVKVGAVLGAARCRHARAAAADDDRLRAAEPGPRRPARRADAAGAGRRVRRARSPPCTPRCRSASPASPTGGRSPRRRRCSRSSAPAPSTGVLVNGRRRGRVAVRCSTSPRRRSSSCAASTARPASVERRHRRRSSSATSFWIVLGRRHDLVALPAHRGDQVSALPPPTGVPVAPVAPSRRAMIELDHVVEVVRRRRRRLRRRLLGRAGHHRAARPQRRRQVDGAAAAVRAGPPVAGPGPGARAATRARTCRSSAASASCPQQEALFETLTARRVRRDGGPAAAGARSGRRHRAGARPRWRCRPPTGARCGRCRRATASG